MYRLWLDDVRPPPNEGWEVVRSFEAFKKVVEENGIPAMVSFDYDLTLDWKDKKTKTGMACAIWLREKILATTMRCPMFEVHSTNTDGARKIRNLMNDLKTFLG